MTGEPVMMTSEPGRSSTAAQHHAQRGAPRMADEAQPLRVDVAALRQDVVGAAQSTTVWAVMSRSRSASPKLSRKALRLVPVRANGASITIDAAPP